MQNGTPNSAAQMSSSLAGGAGHYNDGKAPAVIKEGPIKIELPVFKPKNECNVIKIIQKEWEREVERLN